VTCVHCGAATNGVVLCARCVTTTAAALTNVASHHTALFSLGSPAPVRRRTGMADPTGNAVGSRPPSDSIETAAAETTTMLVGWTRALVDDRGVQPPANNVSAMAAFLTKHLASIATLGWAGELLRQALDFERRLQRLVSRNQGHWYAGICGAPTGEGMDDWCPADLFVRPGERYVRCRACGAHWSVDQRRAAVIEEARDALLPVAVIARAAVSLLGEETSQQRLEARLRQWVKRGQLDDYGVRVLAPGQQPRRVYRLGEVMDLLARQTKPEPTGSR